MQLERYAAPSGPRWAADGRFLSPAFTLGLLLQTKADAVPALVASAATGQAASGRVLAPIEPEQEVWAAGVTYSRSREARKAESAVADVYERVYAAGRPELFMKAAGWRVVGPGGRVRVRRDSHWNVPEPELTLVLNCYGEIIGFCAGNDVSSRDIEGENPLYLPQAKVYNGACALGPGIVLAMPGELGDLPITLEVTRGGESIFQGETRTSRMKRGLEELAGYLFRELDFPHGAFLMTGTGIVPGENFSLQPGDNVRVCVGSLVLENVTGE